MSPHFVIITFTDLGIVSFAFALIAMSEATNLPTNSPTSVVQWLPFFPFFLVAAPQKWSKPKKGFQFFFSRVTEQLSNLPSNQSTSLTKPSGHREKQIPRTSPEACVKSLKSSARAARTRRTGFRRGRGSFLYRYWVGSLDLNILDSLHIYF